MPDLTLLDNAALLADACERGEVLACDAAATIRALLPYYERHKANEAYQDNVHNALQKAVDNAKR